MIDVKPTMVNISKREIKRSKGLRRKLSGADGVRVFVSQGYPTITCSRDAHVLFTVIAFDRFFFGSYHRSTKGITRTSGINPSSLVPFTIFF